MSNYKHIVALFCLKKSSNFSLLFYSIVGTFLLPFISAIPATHSVSHIRTKQSKHSTTYNFFTHWYFFYVSTSTSRTFWDTQFFGFIDCINSLGCRIYVLIEICSILSYNIWYKLPKEIII